MSFKSTSLDIVEGKNKLTFRWRETRLVPGVTSDIKPLSDRPRKKHKVVLRCWLKIPEYGRIIRARCMYVTACAEVPRVEADCEVRCFRICRGNNCEIKHCGRYWHNVQAKRCY